MVDDQVRAGKMTDKWPAGRIIHGVRHVTHQNDIFTDPSHLSKSKRSPEHAHVGVDASQDDVLDLVLFENGPHLIAAVGKVVKLRMDRDSRVLFEPRCVWVATLAFQFLCPRLVLIGMVIFTSIRLIDGIERRLFAWDFRAPQLNVLGEILDS